jgi:hypothetical protein
VPELDAWTATTDSHGDPPRVRFTVLDSGDGIEIRPTAGGFHPSGAKSADGRLWFARLDGVGVIDPAHIPINRVPPPVHIEQIIADRTTYDAALVSGGQMRLPALTRDIQIDYTALSLVASAKNRFRYKLEGYDSDWHDAGTRRQAFYNDLPPRNYTFHVIAANNSGVWNETGATLDFAIAPAYYQTAWFRALVVIAFISLAVAAYRLRLRQIASYYNVRLDARVAEAPRASRATCTTPCCKASRRPPQIPCGDLFVAR